MQVWSLGQEDPLEKEMATCSSILAWKVPWTEEPSRLQSMGSQRVRQEWARSHIDIHIYRWFQYAAKCGDQMLYLIRCPPFRLNLHSKSCLLQPSSGKGNVPRLWNIHRNGIWMYGLGWPRVTDSLLLRLAKNWGNEAKDISSVLTGVL